MKRFRKDETVEAVEEEEHIIHEVPYSDIVLKAIEEGRRLLKRAAELGISLEEVDWIE